MFCSQDPWNKNAFFSSGDVLDWNFKLAEKYFTSNELIINEASMIWNWVHFAFERSGYYQMIKAGLEKGLRIDTVGMQYHVFCRKEDEKNNVSGMYNPRTLFAVMDTYEKLGKPIQITETTIPSYSDSAEDEKIQAELIEQLYSIWFSHKAVEAIIYWNLPDGYAAFAPQGDMQSGENKFYGGVRRFDLSEKPASKGLKNLFQNVWHTETESATDDGGVAKLRGFYGEYDAEIICNGMTKTVTMPISSKRNNEFEVIV